MTRKVTGKHKIGVSLSTYHKRKHEEKERLEAETVKIMIGSVPRLAPGEVNPMWATSKRLPSFAKRVAHLLDVPEPKKTKRTLIEGEAGYFTVDKKEKIVDIPDIDINE